MATRKKTLDDHLLTVAKFQAPPLPHYHISRAHLKKHIDCKSHWQVTLIVAPQGSGKTTLMAEWYHLVADKLSTELSEGRAAWLSCDEQDNNGSVKFWVHIANRLVALATNTLNPPQCPAVDLYNTDPESYFRELSNILFATKSNEPDTDICSSVLFIDCFECLGKTLQEQALGFFSKMLPNSMSIVLSCSSKPSGIDILYSQDKVHEINPGHVLFTPQETAEYLEFVMGEPTPADRCAYIYQETEGWIGAIKTIAFSYSEAIGKATKSDENKLTGENGVDIKHPLDISALLNPGEQLANFFHSRTHGLSPQLEEFLFETSFMDRFCPSLAENVTQQSGARFIIDQLVEGNTFIALTDCRQGGEQWYRYHPLFLRWLRNGAHALHPDLIRDLNYRASKWFEAHAMPEHAARHLLLAFESELLEMLAAATGFERPSSSSSFLAFTAESKAEALCHSPFLSLCATWAYISCGRPKDARYWLIVFQKTLQAKRDMAQSDEKMLSFAVDCAVLKCLSLEGEFSRTTSTIETLLKDDTVATGTPLRLILTHDLAESYVQLGKLADAQEQFLKAEAMASLVNSPFVVAFCRYEFANLQLLSGNLTNVRDACYRAIRECPNDYTLYGALYSLLARTQIESGLYKEAAQSLNRAFKRLSPIRNLDFYLEAAITQAYFLATTGKIDDAYEHMVRAVVVAEQDTPPRGVLLFAYSILSKLAIAKGSRSEAEVVAIKLGKCLSEQDYLGHLLLRFLRLQIMSEQSNQQSNPLDALDGYTALISEMLDSDIKLYAIDPLLSQSVLLYYFGHRGKAIRCFTQALMLGIDTGITTPFIISYQSIRPLFIDLLGTRKTNSALRSFAKRIQKISEKFMPANGKTQTQKPETELLVDLMLTKREFEVLTLLSNGMSRLEIAQTLNISLNTAKAHITNIYQKLGVNNRREAIIALDRRGGTRRW